MPHITPKRQGRLLAASRILWAAVLLGAPSKIGALLGGADEPATRNVTRILGARHALQATVELTTWPRYKGAGTVIDTIHAATALTLAAIDRRWRRIALADTTIAAAFGLAGHQN